MRLRLLDFDGSLMLQEPLRRAVVESRAQRIDLRTHGPKLRLWADATARAAFLDRLAAEPMPSGDGPLLTFLGSGDFHHLGALLILQELKAAAIPISVIHFDNHPDWDFLPPTWHCGSWINRLLQSARVARVVTLGPSSQDLDLPQLKTGNITALASGRLELHPWRHRPTRVWGKIGDGFGHRQSGRYLIWNDLVSCDWPKFLDDLIARLPTDAIWITIDKDVLRGEEAATNWDQGEMPLDTLIAAVQRLCAGKELLGIDICGDFAPPIYESWAKYLAARFFQPRRPPAPGMARIAEINSHANARIIEALGRAI